MAIFPAVFVEKLPEFLQKDAKRTAGALLGQNREGIVFWRLHPELPKFLVVFRRREERDVFFRSNQLQQVVDLAQAIFSPAIPMIGCQVGPLWQTLV